MFHKPLLITLMLFGSVLYAQTPEQNEVAAAVETLRKAMVDADKATLEKITAEGLSYGHSGGLVENKAAFVEALVSGKSDFVSITLEDQTIEIVGNVALVRHKLHGETKDRDKPPGTANIGVLLVWQKEKKQWKLLARQAFKL